MRVTVLLGLLLPAIRPQARCALIAGRRHGTSSQHRKELAIDTFIACHRHFRCALPIFATWVIKPASHRTNSLGRVRFESYGLFISWRKMLQALQLG